jgi:hypothetical protein
MAVNLVVAITDYDWFQSLRVREDWPEVNFWAPSATNFRALKPGELFLFKLHSPRNVLCPHWAQHIFARTPKVGSIPFQMGYCCGETFIAYSIMAT